MCIYEYIIPHRSIKKEMAQFQVRKPTRNKKILWIFLILIFLGISTSIWMFFLLLFFIYDLQVLFMFGLYSFVICVSAYYYWRHIGNKCIGRWSNKISRNQNNENNNRMYFLNAEVECVDLNDIWCVFKKKITEALFSTIALPAAIGFILDYIFIKLIGGIGIALFAILLTFILILSPIYAGKLLTNLWILRDGNIMVIKNTQPPMNIGFLKSRGIFKSFLSVSAIILSYNYYYHLIIDYFKHHIATIILIMYLVWIPSLSILISFLYLYFAHEELVNKFRVELIRINADVGVIIVRRARKIEKNRILRH
ncbi:MAG: hypothetical protein ACFFAH_14780 [Promethearchaeota archaeon]